MTDQVAAEAAVPDPRAPARRTGQQPRRVAGESAWSGFRAWHLHAPAERLPLPAVLITWPAAWVLHAARVPGLAPRLRGRRRDGARLADLAAAPARSPRIRGWPPSRPPPSPPPSAGG